MDNIYYTPIVIPYPMYLIELGIEITTIEEGTQAEIGVYTAENGVPLSKLYSNLLSLNTLDYRFTPCAISLAPGLYFFAFNTNSSTATFKMSKLSHTILGHISSDLDSSNTSYVESNTFANGMPDSVGDISLSSIRVPRILARIK